MHGANTHDVADFAADVIERSRQVPVVADFWAAWCAPCRALGPVLERLAAGAGGRWELRKVDTDRFPEWAQRYGVRSIPAVKLFVNGEVVDEFVGALPEAQVQAWLQAALPDPLREDLERVRRLLAEDRLQEAAALAARVLAGAPDDAQARVLLARCLWRTDPERALELVEEIGVGEREGETAAAVRLLAEQVRRDPAGLPDGAGRERYAQALVALRGGQVQEALRAFIEVLERDRRYDDDGARRSCLALFRVLGEEHPLTERYRTPFSCAVYA